MPRRITPLRPRYALAGLIALATPFPALALTPQTTLQPSTAVSFVIQDAGTFNDVGVVDMFAFSNLPNGTLQTDGSILNVATNSALASQIGDTFGGNGSTTFALPDLNGRIIVGSGGGPSLTSRTLGNSFGSDANTLTTANLPVSVGGSAQPLNNLQPSLVLNALIAVQGVFPTSSGAGGTASPYIGQIISASSSYLINNSTAYLPADGRLLPITGNTALFSILGTTYGGDGTTDFALPDLRGRTAIGAGTGPGLTPRALGSSTGTESTALSLANLPPPNGSSTAYSNMQPSLALNYIIATSGIFPSLGGGNGSVDNSAPTVGQISLFVGNFAPPGWALCNGASLLDTDQPVLYDLIGTTYGGTSTTFNLPDFQGRTAIGADFGTGLNGLTSFALGSESGVESLSLTSDQVPPAPEPASLSLLTLAAAPFLLRRRR